VSSKSRRSAPWRPGITSTRLPLRSRPTEVSTPGSLLPSWPSRPPASSWRGSLVLSGCVLDLVQRMSFRGGDRSFFLDAFLIWSPRRACVCGEGSWLGARWGIRLPGFEAFPICSQFFSRSILGESFGFGVLLRSVRRLDCSSCDESLAKNESWMFPWPSDASFRSFSLPFLPDSCVQQFL
jgi:hypothetical protein